MIIDIPQAIRRNAYKLCICIPTFKRPHALGMLLDNLSKQTCHPDLIIIVDGAPAEQEVVKIIASLKMPETITLVYVPSNYANLPYQRYLGWKAAQLLNCNILLYLDDDLKVSQRNAIEKTVAPLLWKSGNIVGVTAQIDMGDPGKISGGEILVDQTPRFSGKLVRWLGAARKISHGGFSPSGHRVPPLNVGNAYEPVQWLRGGVMSYNMTDLTEDCFSTDLFSLYHRGMGKAEDSFLSRRVGVKGNLLMAFCATFEHPDDNIPRAYPTQAFRYGYAIAYSRRLLNDYYRGSHPPLFLDRLELIKSYLGVSLLNWWGAIISRKNQHIEYARGYAMGALRGLIQKPTAKNLTPNIDWWKDADAAMQNLVILREAKHE